MDRYENLVEELYRRINEFLVTDPAAFKIYSRLLDQGYNLQVRMQKRVFLVTPTGEAFTEEQRELYWQMQRSGGNC